MSLSIQTVVEKLLLVMVSVLFLFAGCSDKAGSDQPAQGTQKGGMPMKFVSIGGSPPKPESEGDLLKPYQDAVLFCTAGCHALPNPNLHSSEEWQTNIVGMVQTMRLFNLPIPDAETHSSILKYYQTKSK